MNLQEQISRIQSMMGAIKELSETTDDVVGKEFWFEYHCFESPKSCDAELWYRTHNKVLVLSIVELGCGDTKLERLLEGCPRVYRVVFEDGFEYDVFEDELMESKEEFERPDAPKKNQQESIRRILREPVNESTFFRRRVDMSTIDKKFLTNLNIVTDKYLRKHNGYCSFNVFRTTVISYLIDDYRDNLSDEDYDNFPYDEVYDFLLKHFYNKIKDRYVEVFGGDIQESIRKVLKEEYKIPLNVRRRLHILRNILGSSLRSSYPCDYDDLDEFIEDTISDVNQYFKWIEKKKEMTSEEAELTIRGYLLDDIKEYYLEEIQNC
jgi:hypothetical protein